MDIMGSDRKVWTAVETHALITLKEEMKPKFQTMKRNRSLWIELSNKLRKDFGHERTPAQCAVRWKNIMSAYKDSRDALRSSRPDSKVCSFFKELEAILGDPPLALPVTDEAPVRGLPSPPPPSQSPRKRERLREQKDANIVPLLAELISKVDAQGAAIGRIERMLLKAGIVGTPPATDILTTTEPMSVSLPDAVTAPTNGTARAYGNGDTNVLLERHAPTSVPELAVTPDVTQSDLTNGTQIHTEARPIGATAAQNLPPEEQTAQDVGVTHASSAGDRGDGVVAGEEVPALHGTVVADEMGYQGPTGCSRPATPNSMEPVVPMIPKPTDVHEGVDESLGGSADVDMVSGGFDKETDRQGPVTKRQKLAHAYRSES